jgi:hypothetical protein
MCDTGFEEYSEHTASNIAEIRYKLQADMQGILLHLNEKIMLEDLAEKERKERDERMKEEGRAEERTKHFLDMGEIEDSLADGYGSRAFLNTGRFSPVRSSVQARLGSPRAAAADLLADHPERRSLTPHAMVLNSVDSEVRVAEDLFKQMKKLRGDLKKRMAHIDDIAEGRVAGDIMKGHHENRYRDRNPQGNQYTVQSCGRFPSSQAVGFRVDRGRYTDDNDYDDYDNECDEEIKVDLKHSSISSAAKAIQSDLNVTLNTLYTRLTDEHEAMRASVSSSIATATESVINKLAAGKDLKSHENVSGGASKSVAVESANIQTVVSSELEQKHSPIDSVKHIPTGTAAIVQMKASDEVLKKEIDAVLGRESIDAVLY